MIIKFAMTFIIMRIIQIYTPNDFVIIMKDPILSQTKRAIQTLRVSLYPLSRL